VIQYKEFLPVMVDVLHSLKAKQHAQAMQEQVSTEACFAYSRLSLIVYQ